MLKRAFLEVGMNNDTILLENISKSFGEHQIIEDLNIEITRGEIVSFVGANGTGKSTILKMIAGLIYQDSGNIYVFGINNQKKKNLDLCEFVMESGQGYYGYLSAYENARYFFGLNKIRYQLIEKEFLDLCQRFDFKQHLDKKVDALSQGNRQKLALIVALIIQPEVLLLDEPTNGLDSKSIHILSQVLLEYKQKNMTILMTSHDMSFMKAMNSRTIFIKNRNIALDTSINQYVKEDICIYHMCIADVEYEKFIFQFPQIELTRNETYFEVYVTDIQKKAIILEYDVLEFSKESMDIIDFQKSIEYVV